MGSLSSKVGAAFLAGAIGLGAISYMHVDSVKTVINEGIVKKPGKQDKYLLFTDNGVFENADSWYQLKFNSSDIQNTAMKNKGSTVEIKKYGWRVPLCSWYENVLKIREVRE